jgi:hypothetical protein
MDPGKPPGLNYGILFREKHISACLAGDRYIAEVGLQEDKDKYQLFHFNVLL